MTKLEELKRRQLKNTAVLVFCAVAGMGGALGLADQGIKLSDAREFNRRVHSAEHAPTYTDHDRKRADETVGNLSIALGGSFVAASLGLVGGVIGFLRREAINHKIKHVQSYDV